MKIIIDDKLLDSAGLTLSEFLYLMLLDLDTTDEILASLEEKGWLRNGIYTEDARARFADILNQTKEEPSSDYRIDNLVENLRKIFPEGKKDGTPYYWRCNKKEIKDKLKKFFVYFGDRYSDEQILSAARKYVTSFNGNYRFMRILKYFIWKNDRKDTPEGMSVEQVSDLATYIENEGQDDLREDWISNLL